MNAIAQRMMDKLVDDQDLNTYLDHYMDTNYPQLRDEMEDNEKAEELWYALRNERFLLVLAQLMVKSHNVTE